MKLKDGSWAIASDEDIAKLIEAFPPKWKLALRMLATYGMRVSELVSLTPENVVRQHGTLILRFERVKRGTYRTGARKGQPKPVNISEMEVVPELRTELEELCFARLPHQKLFPCSRLWIYLLMQSAARKTGIDPRVAHPHALRHNRGRCWAGKPDASPFEVAALLGHRGLKTVEMYSRLAATVPMSRKYL
jgi:integrase